MSTKLVNLEIGYSVSIEHIVPLKEGKFVQQGKASIINSDFVLFKYVFENWLLNIPEWLIIQADQHASFYLTWCATIHFQCTRNMRWIYHAMIRCWVMNTLSKVNKKAICNQQHYFLGFNKSMNLVLKIIFIRFASTSLYITFIYTLNWPVHGIKNTWTCIYIDKTYKKFPEVSPSCMK